MVLQGWREEGGSKLWRLEDESTIVDENEHDGLIDGSGELKLYAAAASSPLKRL
jgi:hypothetical protein